MAEALEGYDEKRFEKEIPQEFHCIICLNVLKDPVLCRKNEHQFCKTCILRHLTIKQECPVCKDDLTPESLSSPHKIYQSFLSGLKIHCDYYQRGCRDLILLECIEDHVKNCGFASVRCPNEGCLQEINKRDATHHQTELCEFRKLKCHDCSEIRNEIDLVNEKLDQICQKQDQTQTQFSTKQDQICQKQDQTQTQFSTICQKQDQICQKQDQICQKQDQIETQLCTITQKQDQVEDEVKTQLEKVVQMTEDISVRQAERIENTVRDVIRNEVKTQLSRLHKDEVKEMEEQDDGRRQEKVVIAGGYPHKSTVEMFDSAKMAWVPMQPMKQGRHLASASVHDKQIFVSGGTDHNNRGTNEIEIMKCDVVDISAEKWFGCPAELPAVLWGHSSEAYNDRLFVFGGCDRSNVSNNIWETCLQPPYTSKLVTKMPEPRRRHGSVLIDDKVFICGGSPTGYAQDSLDSALIYDVTKNECHQLPALPYKVMKMAVVKWGGNAVIIGGENNAEQALNTSFIYDVSSGKSYFLPEMSYKRCGCAAAVLGREIFVMGGVDENGNELNTAEAFNFDSYSWRQLPEMNEDRWCATAVTI